MSLVILLGFLGRVQLTVEWGLMTPMSSGHEIIFLWKPSLGPTKECAREDPSVELSSVLVPLVIKNQHYIGPYCSYTFIHVRAC